MGLTEVFGSKDPPPFGVCKLLRLLSKSQKTHKHKVDLIPCCSWIKNWLLPHWKACDICTVSVFVYVAFYVLACPRQQVQSLYVHLGCLVPRWCWAGDSMVGSSPVTGDNLYCAYLALFLWVATIFAFNNYLVISSNHYLKWPNSFWFTRKSRHKEKDSSGWTGTAAFFFDAWGSLEPSQQIFKQY